MCRREPENAYELSNSGPGSLLDAAPWRRELTGIEAWKPLPTQSGHTPGVVIAGSMSDVISTLLRRFLRPRPATGRVARGLS
jgi:hypothetical protein